MSDTIIALATPPGVSALAILRLSGEASLDIARKLAGDGFEPVPRGAYHRTLRHHQVRLDDVVLTYWKNPHSFTGEDAIEITCHGNPLIAQNILAACLALGARPALPGEFSQRAFLNGKMDLTQAEAIVDLIQAGTDHALAGAQAMQEGKLGAGLQTLRTELINLLAHLEAHIDFPEEDISPDTGQLFRNKVQSVQAEVKRLLATAPYGRILREGIATVIVGEPNVGKSSLLNALLREDRAIVSPSPGTTRDTIEAECNIRGIRLRLIDTAGRRKTDDAIEAEGVRRAEQALAKARLIIHVIDGHLPPPAAAFPLPPLRPDQLKIVVANKSDLGLHSEHDDAVPASTQTADGLAALETRIEQILGDTRSLEETGWLTINARQEACLQRANASLDLAMEAMNRQDPPELISTDLRAALQAIGEVVGLATNEDILDQLFKSFCIGK
jgi:tRNA modification GTPase